MVTFLGVSLACILAATFTILQIRRQLRLSSAIAFGCIIPKVCVVNADEIRAYCKMLGELKEVGNHLRRERRWKQLQILWGFLREMTWNTKLFQGVIRFERIKIDPAKSSLDFEPRETLIFELMPESTELRMELYKGQVSLLLRTIFGLGADQRIIIELLGAYKELEQDIIALAAMSNDTCYRDMLIQNLGLSEWRIFDGGSEPEPA